MTLFSSTLTDSYLMRLRFRKCQTVQKLGFTEPAFLLTRITRNNELTPVFIGYESWNFLNISETVQSVMKVPLVENFESNLLSVKGFWCQIFKLLSHENGELGTELSRTAVIFGTDQNR